MSIKRTIRKQYQERVDHAAGEPARTLTTPPEGWMATARQALGISAAQLARMMGQSRANVSKTEKAELNEGASIRTLRTAAEAMGCRFVYAIVPKAGSMADLIEIQARKKATALVQKASTQMALEKQKLSRKQQETEIEMLTQELVFTARRDLWSDP